MKLSNGEKLILVMMSEIYEKLGIKGELDPRFIKASIFDNQLWGLRWKYEGILQSDEPNPPEVDETTDILDMYRMMGDAFKGLPPTDQADVKKQAGHNTSYLDFPGFDGNNDAHFFIAKFLVEELGRYQERKGSEMNSHTSSSIDRYRQMLPVFKKARGRSGGGGLTKQEIIDILNT